MASGSKPEKEQVRLGKRQERGIVRSGWRSSRCDVKHVVRAPVRKRDSARTLLSMQNSQSLKVSFSLKHSNSTSEVANTAWAFRLQYELARVSSGRS